MTASELLPIAGALIGFVLAVVYVVLEWADSGLRARLLLVLLVAWGGTAAVRALSELGLVGPEVAAVYASAARWLSVIVFGALVASWKR